MCAAYVVIAAMLLGSGTPLSAQQGSRPTQNVPTTTISLAEVSDHLPDYLGQGSQAAYLVAVENATATERDAAIPSFMKWSDDSNPKVRGLALLSLNLLYLPSDKRPGPPYSSALPVQYIPAVVAHLHDPDPGVRKVTFAALQSVEYSGVGMQELIGLLLPMLRDPDVLVEPPDPFFVESEKRMLDRMTPEQRAQFEAHPRKVIRLSAVGPGILGVLVLSRQPSAAVDDAMIAFLERADQTKTTLDDCLHILALSNASERVNNEALNRVFQEKAMNIFLLQFISQLRLTPEHLAENKQRLVALSNDSSAHPALRRSAADVAACWTEQRTGMCRPDDKEMREQPDTR